jgi:regulator of sigma E protease
MVTLLAFIFVLGLLIFIHELGHFLAAKLFGIRVERFSIGYPPRMVGKRIGETDYCISWIPFGGYVKLSGMIDESMDTEFLEREPQPWEFRSKPVWQRVITIAAGPLMNIILAVVIFSAIFLSTGVPEPVGPVVGEVAADSPAEAAGLMPDDRIVRINGQPIETWDDLTAIIHARPGETLQIEWVRDGQRMSAEVTPMLDKARGIGLIGIASKVVMRPVNVFEATARGASYSWYLTEMVVSSLSRIITGEESFREALGGPIIIAKMAGESARSGFSSLLMFTAFISLQLGFLNILPVPVLDGGHLVFLSIEAVRRRPVSVKTRMVVQQVGMALLIALMVFIIINDIQRLL